jgi:hypothetical protein
MGEGFRLSLAVGYALVLGMLAEACVVFIAIAFSNAVKTLLLLGPTCIEEPPPADALSVSLGLIYAASTLTWAFIAQIDGLKYAKHYWVPTFVAIISELAKWSCRDLAIVFATSLASSLAAADGGAEEGEAEGEAAGRRAGEEGGDELPAGAVAGAYAVMIAITILLAVLAVTYLHRPLRWLAEELQRRRADARVVCCIPVRGPGAVVDSHAPTPPVDAIPAAMMKLLFALPLGFCVNALFQGLVEPLRESLIGVWLLVVAVYAFCVAYLGGLALTPARLARCPTSALPILHLAKGALALLGGWAVASLSSNVEQLLLGVSIGWQPHPVAGHALYSLFVLAYAAPLAALAAALVVRRRLILPFPFCLIRPAVSAESAEEVAGFLRIAVGLAIAWAWEELSHEILCTLEEGAASTLHSAAAQFGVHLGVAWAYVVVAAAILIPLGRALDEAAERRRRAADERVEMWRAHASTDADPTPPAKGGPGVQLVNNGSRRSDRL